MIFRQLSQRLVNPPLFSLTFNVSNGPPTAIDCTVPHMNITSNNFMVHILNASNSTTQVSMILNTRQPGIYQCTVSNDRVIQGTIDDITATNGTSSLFISG